MIELSAVWLPIAAPLAGATLLALPLPGDARRRLDAIALTAVILAVIGAVCAVVAWPVVGHAARYVVSLGPLDPSGIAAAAGWSLGPVALDVVFLVVAIRARSRFLIGAATVQLALAVLAATLELANLPATGPGPRALTIDPLAITLLVVSVVVGGLITLYALGYEPAHLQQHGLDPRRARVFVAWLLVFVGAMDLLVLAEDVRIFIVGWEATTLCSFMLIGFDGDQAAVTAARRALAYNLLGGIGLAAADLLLGPAGRVSQLAVGDVALPWALPLILAGCIAAAATKSALAPFHPWLLGAMVAAAPVSALLHASAMVKAGSYLLLRLAPAITADGLLGPLVVVLGGFSFMITAVQALRQRDLKRILAYSTISTLGLIAVAAALGSPAALAAGVLLLVFHAVAKALAFLSVGAIEQVTRTRDVEALVGAARTMPRLAGSLVIAAVALALPPFGLVVAKWALLELGARDLPLIALLAIGTAAYLALWTAVIARLIVRRSDGPKPAVRLPRREAVPIAFLALLSVGGLVLAAPIASAVADPAGALAFGPAPGLAAGWSIAIGGGSFAVPAIAALGLAATLLAVVVSRRLRHISAAPYLSGAGVGGGPAAAFHGGLGDSVVARSGGFYWGGETIEATGEAGRDTETTAARPPAPRRADLVERLAVAGGWLIVAAIGLAAAAGAVGARLAP